MSNAILMAELAPQRLRGGVNRLQWLYVALLLAELGLCLLGVVWSEFVGLIGGLHSTWTAVLWDYYSIFYIQHVIALAILAPTFAAGSIAREKALGTFELLLTTEMTDRDIVVGKWCAHTFQAIRWTLPAWPMLAFFHALLGLPGTSLVIWLAGTLLWSAMATSVALVCSALLNNASAALAVSYLLLAAVVFGLLRFADLGSLVPWDAPSVFGLWRAPSVWWLVAITVLPLTMLACTLRPLYRWQTRGVKKDTSYDRGHLPCVSDDPVYWKQRWLGSALRVPILHRIPRRWRKPLWIGLACATVLAVDPAGPSTFLFVFLLFISIPFYSALIGSSAYVGEREKGTWEMLLTTPLHPYDLVEDHYRAISDRIREFWMMTLIPVTLLSVRVFLNRAFNDAVMIVASLLYGWGVARVASPSAAASGLRCSAKASTIWRSLIETSGGVGSQLVLIAIIAYSPVVVLVSLGTAPVWYRLVILLSVGTIYWFVTKQQLHKASEDDLWKAQRILAQLARHRIELDTDPILKRELPRSSNLPGAEGESDPKRRTDGERGA